MDMGTVATLLGIVGTFVGYGIWVGKISQRVTTVEKKQESFESIIGIKLDKLNENIQDMKLEITEVRKDIQYMKSNKGER